ncbi:MAG: TPM domain-containing protein [Cyclobacteriaceae bacterium]
MRSLISFSEAEKQNIESAVQQLEKETSGELVPYFVQKSDDYLESNWFSATVFTAFGILLLMASSWLWKLPQGVSFIELMIFLLVMMVVGFLFPFIFPVIRAHIAGQQRVDERVFQRATEAFVECGIFNTKSRTGILLFISALEHEVVILADEGINKKTGEEAWQKIVDELIVKIKEGAVATGIVQAIDSCRLLLISHGFNVDTDGPNQLPDGLIER